MKPFIISQPPMFETIQANLNTIEAGQALASKLGIDTVVFPECMLTGFHRKILSLCTPEQLNPTLNSLQSSEIRLIFGSPVMHDSSVVNSYLSMKGGIKQSVGKVGLTKSEEQLFSQPAVQEHTLDEFGIIICREIEDEKRLKPLFSNVQALLWPGYIGWLEDGVYQQLASSFAKSCNKPLFQANWANGINHPDAKMGGSLCIKPDGTTFFVAPNEPGWIVVDPAQFGAEFIAFAL